MIGITAAMNTMILSSMIGQSFGMDACPSYQLSAPHRHCVGRLDRS